MTTKAPEKFSLEIKRFINAPRDRVYAAWTDPAQLKQWFGPENIQTHDLIADVRVGGKFRWNLSNAEGEKMTCCGEYRELQPGKKIVFTWQWEDDVDWENQHRDGGTRRSRRRDRTPFNPRATAKRRVTRRPHARLEQRRR